MGACWPVLHRQISVQEASTSLRDRYNEQIEFCSLAQSRYPKNVFGIKDNHRGAFLPWPGIILKGIIHLKKWEASS